MTPERKEYVRRVLNAPYTNYVTEELASEIFSALEAAEREINRMTLTWAERADESERWQSRALAAEAESSRLRKALEQIASLKQDRTTIYKITAVQIAEAALSPEPAEEEG